MSTTHPSASAGKAAKSWIACAVLLASCLVSPTPVSAADGTGLRPVRGVIHLDTTISGGTYEPEEMVRFLHENGMQAAIFTDQATLRWDYGFFPARYLIGWATGWAIGAAFGRTGSVETFGAGAYLKLLDDLDEAYPEIVVVPGVEAIPFFYWSGSLLDGSLTLVNGYKHLLVFGMASPDDYAGLPSVGAGTFRGYGLQSVLSLWPIVPLFFGIRRLRRAVGNRLPGWALLAIGSVFLLHNFPFRFGPFDQYHGDQGSAPYQALIDYVSERDGIVIWAHPEIEKDFTLQKGLVQARMTTKPYPDALLQTHGYTGFAAFAEGMKYVIPAGGIWDQVLLEYTRGYRARPVWAIAEGDVEGDAFSPKLSQTVFWVEENERSHLLQALREGRVHALTGPLSDNLHLQSYGVAAGRLLAASGQTIEAISDVVRLQVSVVCDDSPHGNALKVDINEDGVVIETLKGEGRLAIDRPLPVPHDGRTHYIRLDVRAPKQTRLLTNPIFFRAAGEG